MRQDRMVDGPEPRRVVGLRVSTTCVGTAWFTAALLPLTGDGPLSRSSSLDAVRLVRTGALDAVLDPRVSPVLLLLPALGLLLIALSWVPGTVSAVVQRVALALGVLAGGAVVVLVAVLVGSWGPATYLVACSLPIAVATLLLGRRGGSVPSGTTRTARASHPDVVAAASLQPPSPSLEEIPR